MAIIVPLLIVSFLLGCAGFHFYFESTGQEKGILDIAYRSLQLFVLESGTLTGDVNVFIQIARFIAPLTMAYTAIVALYSIFKEKIQIIKARSRNRHVVICGLGNTGNILTTKYLDRGCKVVAVEIDAENDHIQNCREQDALVILGDASQRSTLLKARVQKAEIFLAACGDDDVNLKIGCLAQEIARRNGFLKNLYVYISSPKLYGALLKKQVTSPIPNGADGAGKRKKEYLHKIEFFNKYDFGARVLLDKYSPFAAAAEKDVHIAILGTGYLCESLVLHCIAKWDQIKAGNTFKITIMDKNAEEFKKRIKGKYTIPKDLHLEAESSIEQKTIRGLKPFPGAFYITHDDEDISISHAFDINDHAPADKPKIIVNIHRGRGISSYFNRDKERSGFSNIEFFGPLEETNDPEYLVKVGIYNILARAIHERYLIAEMAQGLGPDDKPTIVEWDKLSDENKKTNAAQAAYYPNLLEKVGCGLGPITDWAEPAFREFTAKEIEEMAKMEHGRFVKQKEEMGWKYGKERDDEKKILPSLVPWEKLSEDDKNRDRKAVRNIPRNLRLIGYQVNRVESGGSAATGS